MSGAAPLTRRTFLASVGAIGGNPGFQSFQRALKKRALFFYWKLDNVHEEPHHCINQAHVKRMS